MLSFMMRVVGLFLLVIALVSAVMDITKSIGASKAIFTPFVEDWKKFGDASLNAAKEAVESYFFPFVWDPAILWFLQWPTWLIFAILAFVFLAIGRRRRRKFGRFATR
jgi:hypothetical protein